MMSVLFFVESKEKHGRKENRLFRGLSFSKHALACVCVGGIAPPQPQPPALVRTAHRYTALKSVAVSLPDVRLPFVL